MHRDRQQHRAGPSYAAYGPCSMPVTIYGLIDPRTKMLRYVGQTNRNSHKRVLQHLRVCQKKTVPPVNAWLRGLLKSGLRPEVIDFEVLPSVELGHEAECFWMEITRSWGCDILNVSSGGQQNRGWHHSSETCERMSQRLKGKFHAQLYTAEVRARVSVSMKKRWKISQHPQLGKKHSKESRAKIVAGRARNPPVITPDGKRRISAALRLRHARKNNPPSQMRFDF